MNKAVRGCIAALAAASTVALLAGCGGQSGGGKSSGGTDFSTVTSTSPDEMSALVKAAKKEGKLTFYGVPGESKVRAWVKPFEEKYGITVDIYRGTVTDVNRRFTDESRSGKNTADIVSMSVPGYIEADNKQGWVAHYTPENNASKFDKGTVVAKYAYPLYATVTSIAWNTNEVSEDVASKIESDGYSALLDPSLAARVGVVAPTAGGMQLASNMAIAENDKLGWSYFEKLKKAKDPVFESSVPLVANDLTTGEMAVGIGIPGSVAIDAIDHGAPLRLMYPKGAPSGMHRFFASAMAPHPAAARLFMEWGTSLKGQDGIANAAAAVIGLKEWKDTREITKQSWYHAPTSINLAWEKKDNPETNEEFINKWLDVFK